MTAERAVPEQDLVQRYREGDGDALCELFDRYEGLLRRRIERWLPGHVRRRHSVSDVLQESRIVALDRHLDFEQRGDGAFRRWVLGIAEMKARRAVQRHVGVEKRDAQREVTKARRRDTGQYAGKGPTPSQEAVGSELAEIARKALASLPDDYRRVLRLVREEGLTLREASLRMERSREAVKKVYGRALLGLTEAFERLQGRGP